MVAARETGSTFVPPELRFVSKAKKVLAEDVPLGKVTFSYRPEVNRPVSSYFEELSRVFFPTQRIEYLNFGRTFQELLGMIQNGEEKEEALRKKMLSVALNIWSLRQEITGDQATIEIVTPVHIQNGEVRFRSDLHLIQDIDQMFEESLNVTNRGVPVVPPSQVPRQRRENAQLLTRWQHAVEILDDFDWDQSTEKEAVEKFLQAKGFTLQEVEITPSLLANIPRLRSTISSLNEVFDLMERKKTINAWVGPLHHLTVSPPHWIHAQGKSSFGWNTQVVVSTDLESIWLREHGLFSHTGLDEIVKVLGWGKNEAHSFSSELELMQYINSIVGYSHIAPNVLLHHVVTTLDGFTPAPKMEKNVVEGKLQVEQFMSVIEELFQYEIERCLQNPEFMKGSYERLQYVADKMKDMIGLNDHRGLQELLKEYQKQFGALESAQKPRKKFSMLNSRALAINPNFGVKLNWSLFDCVVGTPFSFANNLQNINMQNLSRADLTNMIGDRAKLWKENMKCRVCHKKGWVGECMVCLSCEAGFNKGKFDNIFDTSSSVASSASQKTESPKKARPLIQLFPPPEDTISPGQLFVRQTPSVGISQLIAA